MSHYLVNMEQLNPSKYKPSLTKAINVLNSLFLDDKLRYYSTPIKDFFDNHLQITAYMQAIQPNKPMDFKTIRHRIIKKNKVYNSSEDIYNDITLVFDNAKKYNKKHTQHYNEAVRLYKLFKCLRKQKVLKPLIQFIPAQDIDGIIRICPLCNNILLALRGNLVHNKCKQCIQCNNIIQSSKTFHCHNHDDNDKQQHYLCKRCVIPFCKSCNLWHHRKQCPFYDNTDNAEDDLNDEYHQYQDNEDDEDQNDENEEEASIFAEADTKCNITNTNTNTNTNANNNNNTNTTNNQHSTNLTGIHHDGDDIDDTSYQSVSSSTTTTSLSLRRRKRIRNRTRSSKPSKQQRNYYQTSGQKRKRPNFNDNEFSDATTNSGTSTSNIYHHTHNHTHQHHIPVQPPLPLPTLPQFSTVSTHGQQQQLSVAIPNIPMPPIIAMPPAKRHKSNNYIIAPHRPPPPPPRPTHTHTHTHYQQPAEIPSPGVSPSAQSQGPSQAHPQISPHSNDSNHTHHSTESISEIRAIISEPPKPTLDRDKVLTFLKQQDFFQNKGVNNGNISGVGVDIDQIRNMENKWFNGTTNNDNYAISICTFIIHQDIKLIYNELQESDESNCNYGAILNKYISAGNNMSQLIQEKKHELYDFVGYHLERFKPNQRQRQLIEQQEIDREEVDLVDNIDEEEVENDNNNKDLEAENWNHQQFMEWVINVKNGRFKRYRKIFSEQEICGYNLAEIEPNDLVEMGIKKVLDKKLLFSLIQELIQN